METREELEKRLDAEYKAYVESQKALGKFVLNYVNWRASMKATSGS